MCFGKDNGPMGPGAVVVLVSDRVLVGGKMKYKDTAKTGVVSSVDWDSYTCVVEWCADCCSGGTTTQHFSEVDVLKWQSATHPPEVFA
jgi:hypothetical protein